MIRNSCKRTFFQCFKRTLFAIDCSQNVRNKQYIFESFNEKGDFEIYDNDNDYSELQDGNFEDNSEQESMMIVKYYQDFKDAPDFYRAAIVKNCQGEWLCKESGISR
ncbi:hypothetical protein CEXT_213641 [Caerostris extrusa]|uniref:Uncharacterized protein n=1 Tax=Caerostris extrusa TaxID=172846 RepID=A0AAV4MBJ1_CAEEX|nr:hypothetical protein CEXT_213641 [Caerostris extrusa]